MSFSICTEDEAALSSPRPHGRRRSKTLRSRSAAPVDGTVSVVAVVIVVAAAGAVSRLELQDEAILPPVARGVEGAAGSAAERIDVAVVVLGPPHEGNGLGEGQRRSRRLGQAQAGGLLGHAAELV